MVGAELKVPGTSVYQLFQLEPLKLRILIWLSVPRATTSIKPGAREMAEAAELMPPPNDIQLDHALPFQVAW